MNQQHQSFGTSWRIGRFFGNTVYLQPTFLFLIAIFAFSGIRSYTDVLVSIALIPLLIFSVMFHELSHALTDKAFGYGNSEIVLHGFGGVTINNSLKRRSPLKSGLVSAMGPIASAILGFAALFLLWFVYPTAHLSPKLLYVLVRITQSFMMLNFVLAIFNALPIIPLDGGHVLQHLMNHFMKNERKSTRYALYVSLVTLVIVIVLSFFFRIAGLWMALILGILAFQNYQMLRSL